MTNFRIVTINPKTYVIHTDEEARASVIAELLREAHPQTDFTIEKDAPFFDINHCNHFFEMTIDSVYFKSQVERRLTALQVAA